MLKINISGGGWYLLGIQGLTVLCLLLWGISSTITLLWVIDKFVTIRMDMKAELLGADLTEHLVRRTHLNAVKVFANFLIAKIISIVNF